MKQFITEPTHILESSASCIDLIFTNQPNIVMDSGVHFSLHEKCHHQIIYSKLNLRTEYPPSYIIHHINLIKRKTWLFQCQRKSRNLDYASLNSITQDISNAVNSLKLKYHERLALNLNDPKTAPKTYWKILKTFVNLTKIPLIPPLLVGNQLVTDFLVKANLFNDYFSQQCTTVDNDSSIPPNITFATIYS